ncbi:hypothetical protein [Streptomyces sp. HNM0574]|uniref:hypothetical protein n=1 Tax=Streptomyces sp. HNM0574 TaxID=2714954 RepID=UPI00146D0934|nr:hypothetical protein [Streptomyces sp. HNM0574]NLU67432.1 hypothetical protein [Streptomyces sp. HNM0574]
MTAEALARTVRRQLRLGRLLPLGEARDGAWITEYAAVAVLRAALAPAASGAARLDGLRVLPENDDVPDAVVPGPPSALPHGPLRIEAGFAALAGRPLPALAEQLRAALLAAADTRLGLPVRTADLHVTALLDTPPGPASPEAPDSPEEDAPEDAAGPLLRAVRAVPGVTRVAPVLGGPLSGDGVHVREGGEGVLVQCAVSASRRALDVARAVREAAGAAHPGGGPVAVLVTACDDEGARPAGS